MTIRVHNVTKWIHLPEGNALTFPQDKPRTVILEVNCPQETAFYIRQDREAVESDPERIADKEAGRRRSFEFSEDEDAEGILTFIGLVTGRERIEFGVSGPFELLAEGGGCYVYTADGLQMETHVVAPVIFTRIANRKQRNPHLEMIQYQMRINQQRFEEQMRSDMLTQLENIKKGMASYAPQRDIRAPAERLGREVSEEPEAESATAPEPVDGPGTGAGGDKDAGKAKRKAPASD